MQWLKLNLDHGLIKWNLNVEKMSETNQKEGWLDPRSKLNEKQSTIGTHEAVVYCPMIDWKTKKKQDLITSGTCGTPWWRHALEMIVYKKVLLKSSLD